MFFFLFFFMKKKKLCTEQSRARVHSVRSVIHVWVCINIYSYTYVFKLAYTYYTHTHTHTSHLTKHSYNCVQWLKANQIAATFRICCWTVRLNVIHESGADCWSENVWIRKKELYILLLWRICCDFFFSVVDKNTKLAHRTHSHTQTDICVYHLIYVWI